MESVIHGFVDCSENVYVRVGGRCFLYTPDGLRIRLADGSVTSASQAFV
jgi:hypothetical protein